jgi:hypothetical protein
MRMAGLTHGAGIVSAARQHERDIAVCKLVNLVDRLPGRDMIAFRPSNKHRCADVLKRRWVSVDHETASRWS